MDGIEPTLPGFPAGLPLAFTHILLKITPITIPTHNAEIETKIAPALFILPLYSSAASSLRTEGILVSLAREAESL
jgi:hypothetical protein